MPESGRSGYERRLIKNGLPPPAGRDKLKQFSPTSRKEVFLAQRKRSCNYNRNRTRRDARLPAFGLPHFRLNRVPRESLESRVAVSLVSVFFSTPDSCPAWYNPMKLEIVLTPRQQKAANSLLESLAVSSVLVLSGAGGAGKTTILRTLHATRGGAFLGAREFMTVRLAQGPAAIEEAFFRMVEDAIQSHDLVLVDDLNLVTRAIRNDGPGRAHLLDVAVTAILAEARVLGRKLVFAVEDEAPWPIQRRAATVQIGGAIS
jgi:hypothetical protein